MHRVTQTEDYSCVHACMEMLTGEPQAWWLKQYSGPMSFADAYTSLVDYFDVHQFAGEEVNADGVTRLSGLVDAFLLSVESPLIEADPEAYDAHCRADGQYVVPHAVVLDTSGDRPRLHDPSQRRYWRTWTDYLDDQSDYPIRYGFALKS